MQLDRRQAMTGLVGLGAAGIAAPTMAASRITGLQQASASLPPAITPAERLARVAKAQDLMQRHDIGAILVESGPSLDYFTGVKWWRSERLTGVVIPRDGTPVVVTPFFERPSVEESLAIPAEVRTWHEHVEPLAVVADILRSSGVANAPVGMEETNRFFIADRLAATLPDARIVSANPVVRGCRMVKSPAELALMHAANGITLEAIGAVMAKVAPGMSGREVRAMLTSEQSARGGDSPWALVLVGPDAALPHGTGRDQTITAGDMILVDTGCAVHGYQSDISRSWVIGSPSAKQRRVWDQVAYGQQVAWSALRLGRPAGSVDDAVRAAYEQLGYGPDYALPGLSHRTGHGIGMEGHEPVNLVRGETTPLAPGMCFSNEPGLYLPGEFGVRLEDCFHMTASGPRWFTVPPKNIDEPLGRLETLA